MRAFDLVTRRDALRMGVVGVAFASGAGVLATPSERRQLGIADLTIKRELQRDYPGTLRKVAALGYREFSFSLTGHAGPEPGDPVPLDKARYAREAGLSVGVVGLRVFNADRRQELDQAAETGARIVVAPPAMPFITGPKRFEATRSAFDAWLPQIVALGEQARSRGLVLAYHNHWFDHAPLQGGAAAGESSLEILARQVSPELLSFEIDFANAFYAGIAPLALVESLGPRVAAMHWKDIDRSKGGDIFAQVATPGAGDIGYAALLPAVLRATHAPGFVEVDDPPDGIASAAEAARLLLPLLRAKSGASR